MRSHISDQGITATRLIEILSGSGLKLASKPSQRLLPLSECTYYDSLAPAVGRRGGILLGIGLHPGSLEIESVIRDAAARGFDALAIKPRSHSVSHLARIADEEDIALLLVDDEIEWRQLNALIDSALSAADEASTSLTGLAFGDLFALANAIAAMVGGATTIENMQEMVLAYSTLPGQPIDEDRRESILGRQVPDLPENPEQYSAIFSSTGAVKFSAPPPLLDRLAVAVRAGSQLLGSIWVVDAKGDLDGEAARALDRAADIAALHMLRARSAADLARQQSSELLRRVLEGGEDSQLIADQLGLDSSGPHTVVAFQPEFAPNSDELRMSRLVDLVAMHCDAHYSGTQCAVIGNTVYSVFSGAGGNRQELHVLGDRIILRAATALHLVVRASLGSQVAKVGQIRKSRHDADLALLLLARRSGPTATACADDVRSELTLLELAQDFRTGSRALSPMAARVLEWDAQHGTDYAKTLRSYLKNSRDSAATAAELSLHQNTLRYRLHRAHELLGIDLNNPDDTLILWLGLRVAQFD